MNAVRLFSLALCGTLLAGCAREERSASGTVPAARDSQDAKRGVGRPSFSFAGDRRQNAGDAGISAGAGLVSFRDVAAERGLRHVWPEQPRPMTALDAFGCGCAAFDGDNDGWQDVLLIADPHPKLFRNVGSGHFDDVTSASGLTAETGDWGGCALGDFNAD